MWHKRAVTADCETCGVRQKLIFAEADVNIITVTAAIYGATLKETQKEALLTFNLDTV